MENNIKISIDDFDKILGEILESKKIVVIKGEVGSGFHQYKNIFMKKSKIMKVKHYTYDLMDSMFLFLRQRLFIDPIIPDISISDAQEVDFYQAINDSWIFLDLGTKPDKFFQEKIVNLSNSALHVDPISNKAYKLNIKFVIFLDKNIEKHLTHELLGMIDYSIETFPLRERKSEFNQITKQMCKKIWGRNYKQYLPCDKEVKIMKDMDWREGNLIELENYLRLRTLENPIHNNQL